jgi:GNAT superfamily N-acetyltransferase
VTLAMSDDQIVAVRDAGGLVGTIVLAFGTDPFVRWLYPDPTGFMTHFSEITRIHAERTASCGGAWARQDGRAAAFWYPPGVHPDPDVLGAVLEKAGVRDRMARVWEEVGAYDVGRPHWYLRQIGVDPMLRGGGHGGRLLQTGLAEVDRRHEIAYLEATSAPGRAFYERHGFSVLGEVRVGDAPPLWPMARGL